MNVGIVGYGTVGKAIYKGFEHKARLYVFDPLYPPQPPYFKTSCLEVWDACDYVFISVPTPQKLEKGQPGGVFDSSKLDRVISDIAAHTATNPPDNSKIPIITSTTLPSKVSEYLSRYPGLNLVMLPEFLTEKNAQQDFLNPAFRIIGGETEHTHTVQKLFEQYSICSPCRVGHCDAVGAAFIKYMINSYLALKVSFLNQFHDLFERSDSGTAWADLSDLFHYDSRVGNSHKHVPGHDGDRGWGGNCFPKDLNAIMRDAEKQDCPLSLLKEAWEYNLRIRSKINWL